jgi:hypothetical protein
LVEHDFDYPGGELYSKSDISDPKECCALCRKEMLCTSWSWAPTDGSDSDVCTLQRQGEFKRVKKEGHVSGLPGPDYQKYQIRRRSDADKCLDSDVSLGIEACDRESETQHWTFDRERAQIRTKQGMCLQSGTDGQVYLQACREGDSGQSWELDTHSGHIKSQDERCLGADASDLEMHGCSGDSRVQWTLWNVEEVPGHSSLFCFSLCVPWTSEPDLLRMQIGSHISIFSCDAFDVYSHPQLDLGTYKTRLVKMDLHVPICGEFHTVCNTPVFRKLWQQLIEDGQFMRHDWTVKVDPDAVFLPDRLRQTVQSIADKVAREEKGAFLNNCKLGLHGPLEVVSRRAMEVFAAAYDDINCGYAPQEDVYLETCMTNLGVAKIDKFDILAEHECYRDGWRQDPDWQDCTNGKAAFHPFKTTKDYSECLTRASPGSYINMV